MLLYLLIGAVFCFFICLCIVFRCGSYSQGIALGCVDAAKNMDEEESASLYRNVYSIFPIMCVLLWPVFVIYIGYLLLTL